MTARIAGHLSASPERNIALTHFGDGGWTLAPPEEVAVRMNGILLNEWESEQYFTMALAGIDLTTGQVVVTQAGHPSSAILRVDGQVEFVESFGMPIGLIEDATFAQAEATLGPGDKLILYSDGITECPDPDERLFDEHGFAKALEKNASQSGTDLLDGIYDELRTWKGDEAFPDDISAILVEFGASDQS